MSPRGPIGWALVLALASGACGAADLPAVAPLCSDAQRVALLAQAVPTAAEVPCLGALDANLRVRSLEVDSSGARYVLAHATAGEDAATVTFAAGCRDRMGEAVDPVAAAASKGGSGGYEGLRATPVDGGCIVVEFHLVTTRWEDVLDEIQPILLTVHRDTLAQRLRESSDDRLDLERNTPADR